MSGSSYYFWAPLGESEAAAGVMAAMFFAGAVVCLVHLKTTNFKLYMEGGALAAIFRGVSLALKAGSIRQGHSNAAMTILSLFFAGAGFGMAISMQLFILAGWLRNTADDAKTALWRPLRVLLLAVFFPCILVFGPILGLTSALVQYASVPPSQFDLDVALKLRKTSSTGMLIITCVALLIVLLCVWTAVRARGRRFSVKRHASHLVAWLVPGMLLLIWAAAYRVQANWLRPATLNDEPLAYPLQVLPELLQLYLVWCLPTVAARIHLSDRFQVWWEEGHGADAPPFGGYASEPQPLPSWVAEEEQQRRKAAGGQAEAYADVESATRPPSPGVDAVVTVRDGGKQAAVPPLNA